MGVRIGEVEDVDEERIQIRMNVGVKNLHEVTQYAPSGIDSRPSVDDKVAVLSLGNKPHKILMGVRKKAVDSKSKPGETRIYSKFGQQVYLNEDGEIVIDTPGGALITMKSNGNIELNGNADSAMSWTDFVSVWNAFIVHMDAHTHTATGFGIPTSSPNLPTPPSASDMSSSERDKVRL